MTPVVRRYNIIFAVFVTSVLYLTVYNYLSVNNVTIDQNNSLTEEHYVETLLDMSRSMIKLEMWDYNYTSTGVKKLEDLTFDSGGHPIRSVIVSAWRSGSNFFGDFLNALPGSFYSHEPLGWINISHILRRSSSITRANRLLKNLLKCTPDTDVADYYTFFTENSNIMRSLFRNRRFYEKCKLKPRLCSDANFGMKICRLSPFHVIKLDRLTLPGVETLLEDKELKDVKIVLLVRDPRGVLRSRMNIKELCLKGGIYYPSVARSNEMIPDCADPAVVCADMVTNFKTAAVFTRKYPGRLMVVRYEDVILNLEVTPREVLRFLKAEFTQSVSDFLKTHTNVSESSDFSTFRVSREVPFKWKKAMTYDEIREIQNKCSYAMSLWGYEPAHNASHMTSEDFYPLSSYTVLETS